MKNKYSVIFLNSTIAFVTAFIITTVFHEFGHFLSYYLLGAEPVMYHNYVQNLLELSSQHHIIICTMAGPVFSLIQGCVFGVVGSIRKKNTPLDLIYLWLSLFGFINFFGYLILTPLSTVGDTGKVAEIIRLPYLFRFLIAIFALLSLILIVLRIGKRFANFFHPKIDMTEKNKYVNHILFFPIVVGSVVNSILAFPVVTTLSIIYPATSSWVIMCAYGTILKTQNQLADESAISERVSLSLVLVFCFVAILNRLLTLGVG